MPKIDLSDDEHAPSRRSCAGRSDADRFPLSPRLAPLRSALAKLDPRPEKPRQRALGADGREPTEEKR
jgi:hypothetical protein